MHRFWKSIIEPLFNEIKPKKIVEIGSERGLNTKNIVTYCKKNDSKLISVDPSHQLNLEELYKDFSDNYELIEDYSLNVLPKLNDYDIILIDGDHNWYTVFNELKSIEKQFNEKRFPVVICHDVAWPYGRRDMYYFPKSIPKKFRHPYKKLGMCPDKDELLTNNGFNATLYNAIKEDLPKNGVKTAIEDFIKESPLKLTFRTVNTYNGLGILYLTDNNLDEKVLSILINSDIGEIQEKEFYKQNLILNSNLKTKDNQIKEISKENNKFKEKNDSLTQNINELTNKLNKKDEIIFKQQETSSLISNELKKTENIINKVQENNSKLINLNQNYEIKIKNQEQEINNLKDELSTANTILTNNDLKIQTLINENNQLTSIKLENEQKLLKQQTILDENEENLILLDKEINDLKEENQILNFNMDSMKKTNQNQLQLIKNQNLKIKEHFARLNNYFEIELNDIVQQMGLLDQQQSQKELDKINNQLNSLDKKMQKLNKDNTSLTKENQKLGKENNSLSKNINQLEKENNSLNKNITKLEKENHLLNNNISELKTENTKFKNEIIGLQRFKEAVINSKSWKITGIFRSIVIKLKKL